MPNSTAATLAPLSLPDCDGGSVRLGSLWADGPGVLVFLRHYGWIFCREHVAQLREHDDRFRAAGARVAAVGLGGLTYARLFREETGIPFPLLIDAQRTTHRAIGLREANLLHVLRRDNVTARARARAAGHQNHRVGRDPFQLGGSFVFGPGDVDHYAHVSETFGDNAPVEDLLSAVAAATRAPAPADPGAGP